MIIIGFCTKKGCQKEKTFHGDFASRKELLSLFCIKSQPVVHIKPDCIK